VTHILNEHSALDHAGKQLHALASYYPVGFNHPRVITGQPTVTMPDHLDPARHIRMIRIEEVGKKKQLAEKKQVEKKPKKKSWTEQELISLFAPFGSPDGQFLVCPTCKNFKHRQPNFLRDHIYREFNFKK